MRKLTLLLILIIFLGSSMVFAQREAKWFAVKSGHIEYELEGSTVGTKTIWFDDYGLKYREEVNATTTTKVLGFKTVNEEHSIEIRVEDIYMSIDLLEKKGSTGKLHLYEEFQEDYYNMTDEEKKEFEEDILNSFGGERLGNDEVFGKNCEIVSVMGAKSWIYKGLTLKLELNVLGQKSDEIVTLLEEDISVPVSMFEAPEGIELAKFKSINDIFKDTEEEEKKAVEDDEQSYDDAEEDDLELIPLTYSFDDFEKAMNKIEIEAYPLSNTLDLEEEYMGMFMKSIYKIISIVATSNTDADGNNIYKDKHDVETFKHNGLNMFYGDSFDEEEEGSVLGIDYPKHDMYVIIGTNQELSKTKLLIIADQLDF